MLALVAFTVLALMAFFSFVLALMLFTFVVALHALHELDAAQDEVLLLIEAEVLEVLPSGFHFFAFGLHLSAFGFAFGLLLFSHFSHLMLALVFTFVLALMLTFVIALMLTFVIALMFTFMVALVFALGFLGFHLGVHLGKEVIGPLIQFGLGFIVHVVPVGIFGLQGAEGAVMLFGDHSFLFRFSGLLRLFRSVVASHQEEASKTHH